MAVLLNVTVNFSLERSANTAPAQPASQAASQPATAPDIDNGPTPAGTYRVGGEIAEPKIVNRVAPVYPKTAREAGLEGYVILEATIDRDGTVVDVRVAKTSKTQELDQAAIAAVKQWVYTPTTVNGDAVPVILNVVVNFSLH